MLLGVITEPDGENRVAIVPNSIKKLKKSGFDVLVESGAGVNAHHSDLQYSNAGATICDRTTALSADIVISIDMPELDGMKEGKMVACVSDPFRCPEKVKAAMAAKITLFSMDMIPRRLSRAQAMDVNSSQDNLAGYKAVLTGAAQVPKGIPMMTTSAGTIRPAKFVIMGSDRKSVV